MSEGSLQPSGRSNGVIFAGGLGVAAVVLALDQLSKWWIVAEVMQPPRVIPVTPFFNLVLGWNRGISFGLFHGDSAFNVWGLPALALAIVAVLLVWLWRSGGVLVPLAIGLIVGGALGNVIDRIRHGAVADFLDFHVAGYHWPAFNVADTGITVGAVLLIFDSLFGGRERPNNTGG
ncbi:MAG: signal peptidase II [Rhodospirillales bacterium]